MSISVFDHPLLSGLFSGEQARDFFSAEAELAAMLEFEAALVRVQKRLLIVPDDAADQIEACIRDFGPDRRELATRTASDGVVVPGLVAQLKAAVGPENARYVHLGVTSQDVIDSGLMMRLSRYLDHVIAGQQALISQFVQLDARFGDRVLMGRTRMQAAIPIRVTDRITSWRQPLERHLASLSELRKTGLVVQFGGAAGTLDAFGEGGPAIRSALATEIGLCDGEQWHSQRDRIMAIGAALASLCGSLGKFGQDIALMAQAGDEISLSGGGTSSAMAHKQNPVQAEILVTLARFAAAQSGGLFGAMVHEQERSGSAWSLEWMILPQICAAVAASVAKAQLLVNSITHLGSKD